MIFLATYQRFDGIVLPEHRKETFEFDSSKRFKEHPSYCNGEKLSSFDYRTKDLKLANHKELRKNGLRMHLQSMHDILVGAQSMDDPIYCVEVTCTTYLSLHKNYLCYKKYGDKDLSCHEWEFNETAEVKCTCTQYICANQNFI